MYSLVVCSFPYLPKLIFWGSGSEVQPGISRASLAYETNLVPHPTCWHLWYPNPYQPAFLYCKNRQEPKNEGAATAYTWCRRARHVIYMASLRFWSSGRIYDFMKMWEAYHTLHRTFCGVILLCKRTAACRSLLLAHRDAMLASAQGQRLIHRIATPTPEIIWL